MRLKRPSLPGLLLVAALGLPGHAKPMDFTRGNDVALQVVPLNDARAQLDSLLADAATQKVTAFEPYVKWMLLEPKEGEWDFTYYDMVTAACRKHGMQWVPFLIAGPAYATPQWFKEGPESVFARCLEEGVLFVPGALAYPSEPSAPATNHARLTYGVVGEDGIEEGIRRLSVALADCLHPVA